jgi:hypothetical protein
LVGKFLHCVWSTIPLDIRVSSPFVRIFPTKAFLGLPGFARPVWEMPYIQKWWCGTFFRPFHNIYCTRILCFFFFFAIWILLTTTLLSLVCDKAIPWFTRFRSPSVRNALYTKAMMWHILSSISQHPSPLYQKFFFLLSGSC